MEWCEEKCYAICFYRDEESEIRAEYKTNRMLVRDYEDNVFVHLMAHDYENQSIFKANKFPGLVKHKHQTKKVTIISKLEPNCFIH